MALQNRVIGLVLAILAVGSLYQIPYSASLAGKSQASDEAVRNLPTVGKSLIRNAGVNVSAELAPNDGSSSAKESSASIFTDVITTTTITNATSSASTSIITNISSSSSSRSSSTTTSTTIGQQKDKVTPRKAIVHRRRQPNKLIPPKVNQPIQLTKLPIMTNTTLKIPTPIFVASLPKSGTTSAWRYFLCGGQTASHLYAKVNGSGILSGECMMKNDHNGRPIFENCGNYSVWTDTGYLTRSISKPTCYYPAIQSLDLIYKDYPNSTMLLLTRNTTEWVESARRWSRGTMISRWSQCNLTGFKGRSPVELAAFYEWHKTRVRDFAKAHPSMTFLEVSIEDPMAGNYLEEKSGIPSLCWADCKPDYRNKCDIGK